MKRMILKSLIHGAVVKEANIDYVGSITIDEELMEKSGLSENETVFVVDRSNGNRIYTYVIKGDRGSGMIAMNGAAAHRVKEGDVIDIMAFVLSEGQINPLAIEVNDSNGFLRNIDSDRL
ncbi:aspartate 1-decarboxylase [bacterium]|nr:MAG: aspartate 1-decarboxylase [bacterium]